MTPLSYSNFQLKNPNSRLVPWQHDCSLLRPVLGILFTTCIQKSSYEHNTICKKNTLWLFFFKPSILPMCYSRQADNVQSSSVKNVVWTCDASSVGICFSNSLKIYHHETIHIHTCIYIITFNLYSWWEIKMKYSL